MKAMMLTGICQMEMMEIPEPEIINPSDVKLKITVVGVCGSDIHYYTRGKIGSQVVKYPFPVGHEGAGMVIAVGPGVTTVKPGDHVAIEPAMPCYECDQCLSGRTHTCRKLKYLGCPGQAGGCLTEYLVMPEKNCFPLHGKLNDDHGSISEPLSIGLYAARKGGELKNINAGILGFGPIGMSVMLSAKALRAAEIYVTDKINERLARAREEGAGYTGNPDASDIVSEILEKEPNGLDVVYECCGQQEAVDQAVRILKPGGKLVIVGIPEFDTWKLDVDLTRRKEITVYFVRRQVNCVEDALGMMKDGSIDISGMVTHRFPFEKTKEAFDFVESYSDGVMKAMIDFR